MGVGSNNFIRLSHKEILPKFKVISNQKELVNVWAKGGDSLVYRVVEVQSLKLDGGTVVLITFFSEGKEADNSILNKQVFLSFTLNEIDYFSEGFISLNETDGNLILKLDKDIYRSEKRINERLLTFPHHQVYAYFKMPKHDLNQDNIVPLKREDGELYLDYKKQRKQKLLDELSKKTDDVKDLVGFRALDISRSGIAFTVGATEGSYFDQAKRYPFKILFDGDLFEVPTSKVVYKVNFVNRGEGGACYKVGLNFNPVSELTQKIMEILRQSDGMDNAHKEFEEFIEK